MFCVKSVMDKQGRIQVFVIFIRHIETKIKDV